MAQIQRHANSNPTFSVFVTDNPDREVMMIDRHKLDQFDIGVRLFGEESTPYGQWIARDGYPGVEGIPFVFRYAEAQPVAILPSFASIRNDSAIDARLFSDTSSQDYALVAFKE